MQYEIPSMTVFEDSTSLQWSQSKTGNPLIIGPGIMTMCSGSNCHCTGSGARVSY